MSKLTKEDIYYLSNNPQKLFDYVQGLVSLSTSPATLPVELTTTEVTVADATDGATVIGKVPFKAGDIELPFGDFSITASVSDTVADTATTPSLTNTTPNVENGVAYVEVVLPTGTYVAGETVTVSITNVSVDGRTLTGGSATITLV